MTRAPGAGGGHQTPKGMGGSPAQPGRMWGGRRGRGKMEVGWDRTPWGAAGGREVFPCLQGPTQSEEISRDRERPSGDQGIGGECGQHLPCPIGLQWACWCPRPEPLPSGTPSGCVGPEPEPHSLPPHPQDLFWPLIYLLISVVVLFCFVAVFFSFSFLLFLMCFLFF